MITNALGDRIMEDKKLSSYKLETMGVVKESMSLYKNYYSLLLKISIVSFLIAIPSTVLSYIRAVSEIGTLYFIVTIFDLIISLPIIYFQTKLNVTMYICISDCHSGKLITFKKAFEKSKKSIWSYIGIGIILGLIIAPFILAGYFIFTHVEAWLIKYLLLLLVAIPLLYLGTVYEFAPIASVLEDSKTSYFKLSKRLVQNNFWRIAVLLLGIGVVTALPSLLTGGINPWYRSLSVLNQNIIGLIRNLLFVFITPVVACITVVLYLTLRKKVVYRQ
jgi:hypothetical protein